MCDILPPLSQPIPATEEATTFKLQIRKVRRIFFAHKYPIFTKEMAIFRPTNSKDCQTSSPESPQWRPSRR